MDTYSDRPVTNLFTHMVDLVCSCTGNAVHLHGSLTRALNSMTSPVCFLLQTPYMIALQQVGLSFEVYSYTL